MWDNSISLTNLIILSCIIGVILIILVFLIIWFWGYLAFCFKFIKNCLKVDRPKNNKNIIVDLNEDEDWGTASIIVNTEYKSGPVTVKAIQLKGKYLVEAWGFPKDNTIEEAKEKLSEYVEDQTSIQKIKIFSDIDENGNTFVIGFDKTLDFPGVECAIVKFTEIIMKGDEPRFSICKKGDKINLNKMLESDNGEDFELF